MSQNEHDIENSLILVDILTSVLTIKQRVKENPLSNKRNFQSNIIDKVEEDNMNSKEASDLSSPTKLLKNLLFRYLGHDLFMVIALTRVGEVLFDNSELYKIFVYCLLKGSIKVKEHIFFNKDLSPQIEKKITRSNFKSIFKFDPTVLEWNFGSLFKAYSQLFQFGFDTNTPFIKPDPNLKIKKISDSDYEFLDFCFKDQLNPKWSENWKLGFIGFSKYFIQDLTHENKCERSLIIIEKFLMFDSIQKQISDEICEQLTTAIKDTVAIKNQKCYAIIQEYLNKIYNSQNSSSILRESLKRLLAIPFDKN